MSKQGIFSRWTTDNVLNCISITHWLLHPNSGGNDYMKSLDYNQEQLQYDCTKWRQAWETMQLTQSKLIKVVERQEHVLVWTGIPAHLQEHVPAVYTQIPSDSARDEGTICTFNLKKSGLRIFEWADTLATVPIQSVELDLGTFDRYKLKKNIEGSQLERFIPFQGGYPLFAGVYSDFKLTVHLAEPGTVEVNAYYTDIPTESVDKLYGQHFYLWSTIDRSRLFQIKAGGFSTAIFL